MFSAQQQRLHFRAMVEMGILYAMQSQVQYTNPQTSPGYTLFAFIFSIIMDSESFHLICEVDIIFFDTNGLVRWK